MTTDPEEGGPGRPESPTTRPESPPTESPEPGQFPDLGGLLRQAQQMQEQLVEAQASLARQQVEGSAGGGMVRVVVSGGLEFLSVTIDPAVVDPDDITMLEDLVLAAVRDAMAKVEELGGQALGGVGPDLGGLTPDLGGLGFDLGALGAGGEGAPDDRLG